MEGKQMKRIPLLAWVLVALLVGVGFYRYQLRAEERASCMFLITVPVPEPLSLKNATNAVRILVKEYPACTRYAATAIYRMVKE